MKISPVTIYAMPKSIGKNFEVNEKNNPQQSSKINKLQQLSNFNLAQMSSKINFSGHYDYFPFSPIDADDIHLVAKDNAIEKMHSFEKGIRMGFANTGLNSFLRSLSVSITEKDPETQETHLIQGNSVQDIIDILNEAYNIGTKEPYNGVCDTVIENFAGSLGELFYDDVPTMIEFSKFGDKMSSNQHRNFLRTNQLFFRSEPTLSYDEAIRMKNTSPTIIQKMSFPKLFEYIEQAELTPKEMFELLDGTYIKHDEKEDSDIQGRYVLDKFNNPELSKDYDEADMPKYRAKLFEILDTAINKEAVPYLLRSKTIKDPYRRNPNAVSVIRMLNAYADFIPKDKKQEYKTIRAMFLPEVPERCKNNLTDETAYL